MSVFRKKSLDRISDPEQLEDYIHVTSPSIWLVLLALVLLLVGILGWTVFGTVDVVTSDGTKEEIHPITLVVN